MAAHTGEKRGLEHLDQYEPKTAKQPRNTHDKMIETRLVVVLEGATLETVKVSINYPWLRSASGVANIAKLEASGSNWRF